MKEAPNSHYNKLIFRETFRDEQSVRRNGGTPTNVTFSNGSGVFNGTSSYLSIPQRLNGVYSIRFRLTDFIWVYNTFLIDNRASGGTGYVVCGVNNTLSSSSSSGSVYIDGVLTTTISSTNKEIVIAGITFNSVLTILCSRNTTTNYVACKIDLFEIYQGTLTASEVKNLYENKWNKEVSGYGGEPKSNAVVNGGFDSDTAWSKGTNWNIVNGTANKTTSSDLLLRQSSVFTPQKKYRLTYTITSISSGYFYAQFGGGAAFNTTQRTTTGTFTEDGVAYGADNTLYFRGTAIGSIDNVIVQELNPKILLDFDSTQGTIKDRTGKNTLTPTDVSIKKIGQSYSADFNGTTSLIDTGSDFIGTKAVTVCGWVKARTLGEGTYGTILNNGRLRLFNENNYLVAASTGSYFVISSMGSYQLNKWQFVSVTRTSAGLANFYIGDTKTAPTLSGSANQNSGTPTAGTTNVIIGNTSGAIRTFDGLIPQLKVVEGILSLEDITQIWSSTRKNYI